MYRMRLMGPRDLVLLEIPALDRLVLSAGKEVRVAVTHGNASNCTNVT